MKARSASDLIGMTRKEMEGVDAEDGAIGAGPRRPVDSATLILLDWRDGVPHVLLGRRARHHAFMPGKFVFPGGRTDPADGRILPMNDLDPEEKIRLMAGPGRSVSATRARAIALSAIRETYEEAGYLLGQPGQLRTTSPSWSGFVEQGVVPDLSPLRFVARAVTPPGRIRRFDTRFLAAPLSAVSVQLAQGGPTQELEGLVWLSLEEAMEADIPRITAVVLSELALRLKADPELRPAGAPIPYFRFRGDRFHRDTI